MSKLIPKYQKGTWRRVKIQNKDRNKQGTYGYVDVDEKGHPYEWNEKTGEFKVYRNTPGSSDFFWTTLSNTNDKEDYNHNNIPLYDYSTPYENPKTREQIKENKLIEENNTAAYTWENTPNNILRDFQLQNLTSFLKVWYDSKGEPHYLFGEQGMSGADPLGKFYVESVALAKPLQLVGRGALFGVGRWGSGRAQNWARAKLISGEMDRQVANGLKYPLGLLVETTLMYTPTKETYVPTSLKFYERGPARISEAERTGVPRGERNLLSHGTSLAPYYDYSLINRHLLPWTVENGQFVFRPPWESGNLSTIHFSFNEPVSAHSGGSWEGFPTVTLLPYRNLRSLTAPVDIMLMDTFFPNYNGLRFSTKGSKILTGDKKTFDYYTSKGLNVEFSPEIEQLLQRLKIYDLRLANTPEKYRYAPYRTYPSVDRVYSNIKDARENIQKIVDEWVMKNRKPIPDFDHVTEFGKVEGLDMEHYPYQLASKREPVRDIYGNVVRQTGRTGLDYDWHTDPSNHAAVIQLPKYLLNEINNGKMIVRPEYKKFLEWLVDHKGDYRE